MLSRKMLNSLSSVVMVCALGLSLGCGQLLDGKKSEPKVLEFSNRKLVCLQDLPAQLKKFSVGQAQELEVRNAFDCMGSALSYFIERVEGSRSDSYSTFEMRRFFGKYFLKENNVSAEFGVELMKIKQALLGGSDTHVSKEEIRRLIDILAVVKGQAVALNPHVKVLLSHKAKSEVTPEEILAATTQLRQSLQKILQMTLISQSNYTFEDAKAAFKGFAEFINGEKEFAPYTRYSQWLPIIESVKNILMGRNAEMNGLSQWSESLDTVIDLYELFLKYHYRLSDFHNLDQAKLREFGQFGQQVIRVLNQSQQMKRKEYIPTEDIDDLIQEIVTGWSLPVSAPALKKVYRVVLLKILEANPGGDYLNLRGLERKHLRSLSREFGAWRLQQSFIDTLPSSRMAAGGLTQSELLDLYKKFDRTDQIAGLFASDPFDQDIIKDTWEDFGVVLQQPLALILTDRSQLRIAADLAVTKQNWKSLTYMNLMRSLSRLLFLGYGQETKGALWEKSFLAKDSLVTWYNDFYELGIELKAFDRRSGNAGARSFMEANFFTFNGNGDDKLSYLETLHFITTLFTAGLSTSGQLTAGAVAAGCGMSSQDPFGKPNLKEDCFKAELRKNFAGYFGNMPGLVKYVQSLDEENWNKFYNYLAVASEQDFVEKGVIETANIRTLVTIFHYIENLMVLFDRDGSGKLSLEEVYAAAPRFTPFFRQVTGQTNEKILREGFAYLVFNGKIPNSVDLGLFQLQKVRGLPDAGHMEILRLFGTLKDQLNKAAK